MTDTTQNTVEENTANVVEATLAEQYIALVKEDNIEEAKALLMKNFGVEGTEDELNLEALSDFHKEVTALAEAEVEATEEATDETTTTEVQEATPES